MGDTHAATATGKNAMTRLALLGAFVGCSLGALTSASPNAQAQTFGATRGAPADANAEATTVGVAVTEAGTAPAIVIRVGRRSDVAYQALLQNAGGQAVLRLDYEYLFRPLPGLPGSSRFYTGLGLGGESRRDDPGAEQYALRLPLGLCTEWPSLHLGVFAEAAAHAGPLPRARLTPAYATGAFVFF
jgi:hypothetical protein